MNGNVIFALFFVVAVSAVAVTAAPINVAYGKPVSLSGEFSTGIGYCGSPPSAPASTLVDGLFVPEMTCQQLGTVWWMDFSEEPIHNSVEIDLLGLYEIGGFTVQADDNDYYRLEYLDANGQWQFGWDVPWIDSYGMVTRSTTLQTPVMGSALRFTVTGGDVHYGVSEIMAFAPEIPEPSTAFLLAGGGILLAAVRRVLR